MRDARYRSIRMPRPSPYRSLTLVITLVVLALLILLLDQSGQLGPLRSQAQTLLSPVLITLSRAGQRLSGVGQELSEVPQLRQEVDRLQEENSRLKAAIIEHQALRQENERLRAELQIEQEKPWKLFGADVAAITPDAGRHLVQLAVGSDQGVKPGMAVIGREGSSPPALIGVVEQVGPRSASVLLVTDFSSAISARVYHGNTVADGVVQGQWQRGSRLRLEQVDRNTPLAPGDVVVTAGLTAQFGLDLPLAAIPRNVPIGEIESVQSDGYSQVAELRPYIDPDQVQYAWVILSQDG